MATLNLRLPGPGLSPVNFSDAGKAAQSADQIKSNLDDAVDNDPGLKLICQMLEFLAGEKIKLTHIADVDASLEQSSASSTNINAAGQSSGFGIEYNYSESYSELEQTSFEASGTVNTADGKEITFNPQIQMERSYHEENSIKMGDAARPSDPLVVNFNGTAAQLTDRRFSFDLDSDGDKELINGLKPGSSFLVFDRNNDGKINNGNERFGPTSGDGFLEPSLLDEDNSGWIDENDSPWQPVGLMQCKWDNAYLPTEPSLRNEPLPSCRPPDRLPAAPLGR